MNSKLKLHPVLTREQHGVAANYLKFSVPVMRQKYWYHSPMFVNWRTVLFPSPGASNQQLSCKECWEKYIKNRCIVFECSSNGWHLTATVYHSFKMSPIRFCYSVVLLYVFGASKITVSVNFPSYNQKANSRFLHSCCMLLVLYVCSRSEQLCSLLTLRREATDAPRTT